MPCRILVTRADPVLGTSTLGPIDLQDMLPVCRCDQRILRIKIMAIIDRIADADLNALFIDRFIMADRGPEQTLGALRFSVQNLPLSRSVTLRVTSPLFQT